MAEIIKKIRAGNQFQYIWAIELGGVAVDLTTATDIVLSYGVGKPCADYSTIPFTIVDTNKISSSHLYGVTGTYNLKLEFKINGEQITIDIDAFKIVPRSEDASDSTQFAVTSDMAIGFKGDKLTFADLTPSDIAELQQPANDAIASIQAVEATVSGNENNRVDAEYDRNQEEINRQEQEVARQTNTSTAIQNAQTATTNAQTATTSANNAATLANTKAGLADTAATNANNVANGYAAELALKEVKSNKQNSLATDGTGTKFPTVDAVNAGLSLLPNSLIAEYTYNGNIEIRVESVDTNTSTFTKTTHGLQNGLIIFPVYDGYLWKAFVTPIDIYAGGMLQKIYYVINSTENTFQISETSGGSVLTLTANANLNLNGWHFECNINNNQIYAISGLSLPDNFRVEYDLIFEDFTYSRQLQYYNTDWYVDNAKADKGADTSLITGSIFCKWIIEYHFSQYKAWYNIKQLVYYIDNATKSRKAIKKDENYFSNSFTVANKNTSIGLIPFSGRNINLANKSTFKITRL